MSHPSSGTSVPKVLDVPEVLVDTSGLYAALDADDSNHTAAVETLEGLLDAGTTLIVRNYLLLELAAVIQRRLGAQPAREVLLDHASLLDVAWVGEDLHSRGVEAWLAAGRRSLSLVDCVSFALMRELHLCTVFTFDRHFADAGFTVVPPD